MTKAKLDLEYEFDFPFEEALVHFVHEEGLKKGVYKDSKGLNTIGIGHNLKAKGLCGSSIKAQFLCDLKEAEEGAESLVSAKAWASMGDYRRMALVSMVFQMGVDGVREFKKTLRAIEQGEYRLAARLALASQWARKDSPERARRVSNMLATNQLVLRDGHPDLAWDDIK